MNVGELSVVLSIDSSKFNQGLDDAHKKALSLGDIIKGAFSFAGGMAIWDGIKNGFKNSVMAGIEFNATMQQNKIAFDTMLGSGDKASKLLNQLSDFAAKTPFEFPELTDAAKKMLAFGFSSEQIMPMLKATGDAAAGLGLSGSEGIQRIIMALGQMQAKGKVSADEMMQLTEAGVPAWDILAKAMGMSTAQVMDLSSKGLIPADKAIQALTTGMEQRFPNMMDKQSQSFSGLMSTLKDNLNITFGTVIKPVFEWLTGTVLPKAIDLTTKFSAGFQSGGLKGALEAIFPPSLKPVIDGVFAAVSGLINFIKNVGPAVIPILVGIAGGFLAFRAITGVIGVIDQVKKAIQGFGSVIGFITSPIGIAVIAIGALIAIGVLLYTHWGQIKTFIVNIWNSIATTAQNIWNGIANFFIGLWNGIKSVATAVWNGIVSFLSGIWNGIRNTASAVWNGIVSTISNLWNRARDIVVTVANAIWNRITAVWNSIVGTISAVGGRIWSAITEPFNRAKSFILGIAGEAYSWGKNLIQNIINGITGMVGKITGAVSNIASKIKSFLGFHSPAEEGPGSDADKWMPNFMNMLNKGIQQNIPKLQATLNTALSVPALEQPTIPGMDVVVGANSAMAGTQTIIIELDGRSIAQKTVEHMPRILRLKGAVS